MDKNELRPEELAEHEKFRNGNGEKKLGLKPEEMAEYERFKWEKERRMYLEASRQELETSDKKSIESGQQDPTQAPPGGCSVSNTSFVISGVIIILAVLSMPFLILKCEKGNGRGVHEDDTSMALTDTIVNETLHMWNYSKGAPPLSNVRTAQLFSHNYTYLPQTNEKTTAFIQFQRIIPEEKIHAEFMIFTIDDEKVSDSMEDLDTKDKIEISFANHHTKKYSFENIDFFAYDLNVSLSDGDSLAHLCKVAGEHFVVKIPYKGDTLTYTFRPSSPLEDFPAD